MKTFEERMASIREKSAFESKKKRNRRIAACSLVSIFAVALALTLFLPYSTALPDVSMYADSPYYSVIQSLNKATYTPPRYKNNFQFLSAALSGIFAVNRAPTDSMDEGMAPGLNSGVAGPEYGGVWDSPSVLPNEPGNNYEEVTDNQVEGVIEADLFKRSDEHLYYLNNPYLHIYAIAKDETREVGFFHVDPFAGKEDIGSFSAREMYLSKDCSTVIVLMEGFTKQEGNLTALVTLDVSDPGNVEQIGFVTFTGTYISSRLVDGDILLTYNFGVYKDNIRFDDPETYVPTYGVPGEMQLIDSENIVCPEEASSCRYTVIAKLDGKSLEVKDTTALMSYSHQLYVSEDTIYATHAFSKKTDENSAGYLSISMTEITGISYRGDELMVLGSVQLEGTVKDQYSMDQHNGILRVAVSTLAQHRKEAYGLDVWSVSLSQIQRNCSLYCIDLSTWEIAASVEKFAPDGDEVTSARFDGDKAYICTAEVIVLTDPVYFFDLTDIRNITWSDTGIIDGYSSSLVNFGEYLLGIGFNEDGALKLEAYVQGKDSVESVGVYERDCFFTNKYKAYYIDRKNNLVGIPVRDWYDHEGDGKSVYLLFHFNGYKFNAVKEIPMDYFASGHTRATIIDGWLYLLYNDRCVVEQVW